MLAGGLGQVPVFLPADFLILQRFEERCGHRIVPGMGGPAHADGNAVVLEQVGINRGRRTARRGRIDVPARAAAAASQAENVKSRPAQPPPEGTGVPPPSLGTWIWKPLFSGVRHARLARSHSRSNRGKAARSSSRQTILKRNSV